MDYDPPNWNDYINLERRSFHAANNLKQKEKKIVKLLAVGKRYDGSYPAEIIIKKHFKDKRQDLDNVRIKGILDGLVACGVIKNDNLKHIQRIWFEAVFDDKPGIEIEIKELENNAD